MMGERKIDLNIQLRFNQRGLVLIYGLAILLILATISVATVQMVIVNEKVMGNMVDTSRAIQNTEAGLVAGENWLLWLPTRPSVGTKNNDDLPPVGAWGGVEGSEDSTWILEQDDGFWTGDTREEPLTGTRYFIEFVKFERDHAMIDNDYGNLNSGKYYYRITARGSGLSSSDVYLQSGFIRHFTQ